MYALRIQLKSAPTEEIWDMICGRLYQLDVQGIDEGEEQAPQGEKSLVAGLLPEEPDEFAQAIAPGILAVPQAFTAYFNSQELAQSAWNILSEPLAHYSPQHQIESVATNIDYSSSWKASFKPLFCPPYWLIHASWHNENELKHALPADTKIEKTIPLQIEPGMAFGTGNHETTQGCLTLMANAIEPLTDKTKLQLLDFGCGSGILAIAGRKLGIPICYAVDIDPLALDASQTNAKNNGTSVITSLSVDTTKTPFDIIVANILKNTLLDFTPEFQKWLKPGGIIILSGLLQEQIPEVLQHYSKNGFTEWQRIPNGEWCSLGLRRTV